MGFYEKASDNIFHTYFIHIDIDGDKDKHSVAPHFHKSSEIIFIEDGEYFAKVGTKDIKLKQGDILFVDSFMLHTYQSFGKTKQFVLVIDDNMLNHLIINENNDKTLPTLIESGDYFPELKKMLQDAFAKWQEYDNEKRWAFMNRFVSTLIEYFGLTKREKIKNFDFIKDVSTYLEENFNENISLKKMAEKFGYTEKYFSKLFNNAMGVNIREFINRFRISKAIDLKENSNLPINKIAMMVGFDSPNTFYRAYKKYCKQIEDEQISIPKDEF